MLGQFFNLIFQERIHILFLVSRVSGREGKISSFKVRILFPFIKWSLNGLGTVAYLEFSFEISSIHQPIKCLE